VLPAVTERLIVPRYISGILGFEDGVLATWTSEEDFGNLKACHRNVFVF
jgi:hypothetical protein